MKRGDRVVLFQDGKLCRGMIGVVVSSTKGHHVKIKYAFYDANDVLTKHVTTLRVDKHRCGGKKVYGYTEEGYCTAEKICNVGEWYRMVTAQRYDEDCGNYKQSVIDDVYNLIE